MHFFHEIERGKGRGLTTHFFSWGGNSSLLNCLFQWLHCMGVSFLRSWSPLSSDYLRWFCHVVWCQYVPFLFCVLFVSNAFFWCHSLPMIFGRWFCPRQVFRCHYLQIFRASFVWRRVLMPLFSDVLVLLLFHYGFWKPVFSDFVVLFFFQGIFVNAVIFCFLPLILPMPFFSCHYLRIFLC